MRDSIGARLRQARELRHLTLPEVSETTKLRTHYLQALESDDYTAIPSAAQARGFLRLYAEFLELDVAELLPPAAPAEPASADAAHDAAPAAAVPARAGLLDGLRKRFARPRKDEAAQDLPLSVPAGLVEAAPAAPVVAEPPVPASAEADTARRPKADSPKSKKKRNKLAAAVDELPPAALEEPAIPAAIPETQPVIDSAPPADPEVFSAPEPAARKRAAGLRLRLPKPGKRPAPASEGEAAQKIVEATALDETPTISSFNPLPAQAAQPAVSSAEIFAEIGRQLCQRREMLSLTYEEIERHTHVRTAFLAALERGALDELPSPVQTRGILVNYATFLDLDAEKTLLRFADGLQARYREKGPQRKSGRRRPPMAVHTTLPPLRAFIASDLVFGGGLAIMLLLFAVWGISRVINVRSQAAPRVTPPPISDVLVGTALPTLDQLVTVIPAEDTPAGVLVEVASPTLELATLDPNVNVQVIVTASERAYLRVMVDGKLAFEGRTEAGSSYTYQAEDQVELVAGNAAALHVTYNQRDLGLMGNLGEVVDRLYTAEGIATPTSTPRPTDTPTPVMTATPSETPTRTPTHTPMPEPGG